MSLEELREAPEAAPWEARASPAGSVPIGRVGLRGQSRGVPLGQVFVVVVANLHFNRFLLTQRGLFSPSRAQRCAWPVKPSLLRWAAAAASSRSARLEGSPAVARRRFPSRDSEPRSLAQLPGTVVGKALPLGSSPQPAIVPWRQLQLPMARGLEQSPGTPQSGTALGAGMLLSVGAKSQPRDQGYLRGVRC